jgi:hypothetical protein
MLLGRSFSRKKKKKIKKKKHAIIRAEHAYQQRGVNPRVGCDKKIPAKKAGISLCWNEEKCGF